MSVLVAISRRDNTKLIAKLSARLAGIKIEQWPDCDDPRGIKFVLAWNAPLDMWQQLPNLKVVSSFGAGVDSIDLSVLEETVQVVRIVDTQLANDMADYVLTHVLAHKLRLKEYFIKQANETWKPKRALHFNHVGLLGYGELAKVCAAKLLKNDFTVSAWANHPREDSNVELHFGLSGLNKMLPVVDVLVCLLPLTPTTKGIINSELLDKLPAHAIVINVARGQHVIDSDLIDALDSNKIAAATLDVFNEEPLSPNHPFWSHPKITITPHCAALSDINNVVEQIAHNINCFNDKVPLINKINRTKGY
ncbi:glyoxylate/hydroxypyruvate reductase A [Pseudoalteromonas sp. MMG010]|uniref:2-hydroxyacid dehydrogenase n=1 Tax=Pseudoalteromonas sp. MMG010 TaxID=2822685 RepID=UPI001B3A5178|nr:glyoxylate/hydroxypyruvate reductase A [Pseudoalteromonas sp. MMG010]MBQ4833078.1 glyoxylate/hydroxypyruvate reductase A [Pseudoalteromonas sp. MMG010]